MKILAAYKSGGIYTEWHVDRLREQVKQYSGFDLTVVYGDYKSWWCKMDLFKVKGPCLFFDLDTTIIDDISPLVEIAKEHRFVTLENWNNRGHVASCIMSWNDDMSHLSTEFDEHSESFMAQYPGGDQDFIDDRESPVFYQKLVPHMIQSYKCEILRSSLHKKCRVIEYHGNPKPWDVDESQFKRD